MAQTLRYWRIRLGSRKLQALLFLLPGLALAAELPPPQSLIHTAPDFRLQSALNGESPGAQPGSLIHDSVGLGWSAVPDPEARDSLQPNAILQLSERYEHVVLADLQEKRLYLLENNGEVRVLRHMYATIGKNGTRKQIQDDGRTPIGVYTVTRYIDDPDLPELYGSGAFPVDYPNLWDRRAQRTGYGIWVHGVPRDNFSRPPLSSEGCVAVGNRDLDSIKPFIDVGRTRVIFSDQLQWLDQAEWQQRRQAFSAQLEAWRQAWNSLDTEAYLAFYADDFRTDSMNREEFVAHKRRVNAHKSFIEVSVDELSIFDYPDAEELRLVEFRQDYQSDTYSGVDWKQQFWRLDDDGQWRIVHEVSS